MFKSILISLGLLSFVWSIPVWAQDEGKLTFDMGGGLSIPLNPAARFTGVGGNFLGGGGYNINKHSAVIGEFQWAGRPPSVGARAQLNGGSASVNLYSISANYKFSGDFGSPTFGYYLIAGGGWYYRHSSVSKSTFIPTNTVCQPIYGWYGYTCTDGFVNTVGVASGTSSGGGNAGVGFTLRVKDTNWRFFLESRYVYAGSRFISTQIVPVTFGFRYQ